MKRFLLFYFEEFYPSGGMNDCKGTFETLELAIDAANTAHACYWHVLDVITGEKYSEDRYTPSGFTVEPID